SVSATEAPYSHLRDFVPVDSFDFTGLQLPIPPGGGGIVPPPPLGRDAAPPPSLAPPATPPPMTNPTDACAAWHYVRQTTDLNGNVSWKFVYPGRYNANAGTVATSGLTNIGYPRPRQQGVEYAS